MIFDFMKKSDIDFIDYNGCVAHLPDLAIKRARDVTPYFKSIQKEKHEEYKFANCPGMLDYSRIGYIIPAWGQIKIKANAAGTAVFNTAFSKDSKNNNLRHDCSPALRFDPRVLDGVYEKTNNVDVSIFNFPSPWRIRCRKGLSALLMPPFFHFKYLEYLDVIPGVVDYSTGFQTVNFITAVKRPVELVIEPGEPLIHVIPIPTKLITATYGKESDYTVKSIDNILSPYRTYKQWYSKFFKLGKKYKLLKRSDENYEIFK